MTLWGEGLANWWVGQEATDPAYREEVLPLALQMLRPEKGCLYLDLGCGEGPLMAAAAGAGARMIGVEGSRTLAARARGVGPVVLGLLPGLGFVADRAVDGVVVVLVLEHVADIGTLFAEAARVTRPEGVLAVVVNHPLITAPGSGPFVDPDDGEVLWRWGDYLGTGSSDEPAGTGTVRFHHRALSSLLTTASGAGWQLERVEEHPVGAARAAADPLLMAQAQVPRLLGARWMLRAPGPAGAP